MIETDQQQIFRLRVVLDARTLRQAKQLGSQGVRHETDRRETQKTERLMRSSVAFVVDHASNTGDYGAKIARSQ
jgi:hypothetical protein